MSLSSMIRIWNVKWSLSVTWFYSNWINVSIESLSKCNWLMLMFNWNSLLLFLKLLRKSNLFSCLMKIETRWLMQKWENFFEFRCNCKNCNLIDWQWIEIMINSISWIKMKTIFKLNFWMIMILFWKFWMILSLKLCLFKICEFLLSFYFWIQLNHSLTHSFYQEECLISMIRKV